MADVSLKITAKNETRTGFQQALGDARRFGQEANRAALPSTDGKGIRGALKGIGSDLAEASTPMEAFQSIATRVAGIFGKVTAAVAGFAFGKILAGQFEKLNDGVTTSTQALTSVSSAAKKVADASTLQEAIQGFNTMQESIKGSQKSLEALKTDLGSVAANALTGGMAFRAMQENIEAMQRVAAASLVFQGVRQTEQMRAVEQAVSFGGVSAGEEVARQQKRQNELDDLRGQLAGTPNTDRDGQRALELRIKELEAQNKIEDSIRESVALQKLGEQTRANTLIGATPVQILNAEIDKLDELIQKRKDAAETKWSPEGRMLPRTSDAVMAEMDAQIAAQEGVAKRAEMVVKAQEQAIKDKEQSNSEAAMTPQQLLEQRNKQIAALDDWAAKNGGQLSLEDQLKKQELIGQRADIQRQLAGQSAESLKVIGSMQASSLQRIGGARNEFADSRVLVNETKKQTQILQTIAANTGDSKSTEMKP